MAKTKGYTNETLIDKKYNREQLNESFSRYLFDGNFNAFFHTLEMIIRTEDSVSSFCEKTGIGKSKLYQMCRCTSVPKFDTIMRILKALGHDIKIV